LKKNYLDADVRLIVKLVSILFDETKKYIMDIISIIYDLNKKDPANEKLLKKSFSGEIYNEISSEKLLKKSFKKSIRNRGNEEKEKSIEKLIK
jgi:hypothetical protein